jgi:hypothetical protein
MRILSKKFEKLYRDLDAKVKPEPELIRHTIERIHKGDSPRFLTPQLVGTAVAGICIIVATALAVWVFPGLSSLSIAVPSSSSADSEAPGTPGDPSQATSGSGGLSSNSSHTEISTVTPGSSGEQPGVVPTTPTGEGTEPVTPGVKDIPTYIGYKTASGTVSMVGVSSPAWNPQPQLLSLNRRDGSLLKLAAGNNGNHYGNDKGNGSSSGQVSGAQYTDEIFIGQGSTITLLIENKLRDAIVDVVMDDSEYGVNNVYSTSATKFKILRVDTQYSPQRKSYITEVELEFPASQKEGERTVSIKEIGFLRSYGEKQYNGKCNFSPTAIRTFTFKATRHPLVEEGYIIINSAQQLDAVRQDLSGKYALACDIDLGGREWEPIGTREKPFKGLFDGCGYTISNYKITGSWEYAGLFGNTQNLTVKNLTVDGTVDVQNAKYVGGVVGSTGLIENCHNLGDIRVRSAVSDKTVRIGGVAGECMTGAIRCSNRGNITADAGVMVSCGGIHGLSVDDEAGQSTIECFNTGTIAVDIGTAAGIAPTSLMTSCYNTGNVTAKNGQALGLGCPGTRGVREMRGCYSVGQVSGKSTGGLGACMNGSGIGDMALYTNNFWLRQNGVEPFVASLVNGFTPPQELLGLVNTCTSIQEMYNISDKLAVDGETAYKNVPGRTPQLKWETD